VANTLTYNDTKLITATKCLLIQVLGVKEEGRLKLPKLFSQKALKKLFLAISTLYWLEKKSLASAKVLAISKKRKKKRGGGTK
jgi:hypothetical protein